MLERANELDLYSSSTTVFTSKKSALAVDEHEHSPARMRYTKFVHYVQNYRQISHRCCCLLAAKIPRL